MFHIFTRNIRQLRMNRNGLSPDALKQIGNLDKKLSAIQVEIRTFVEQKNQEIATIQSQIKGL